MVKLSGRLFERNTFIKKLCEAILQVRPDDKRAKIFLASLSPSQSLGGGKNQFRETIDHLISLIKKESQTVIDLVSHLIEQNPEAFFLWNILGAACRGSAKTQEAVSAFFKVTELNPNFPDGFNLMALL